MAAPPQQKTAGFPRKILIVDGHPMFRQDLAQLIEDQPDLQLCDSVGTAGKALARIAKKNLDLSLMPFGTSLMAKSMLATRSFKAPRPGVNRPLARKRTDPWSNSAIRDLKSLNCSEEEKPIWKLLPIAYECQTDQRFVWGHEAQVFLAYLLAFFCSASAALAASSGLITSILAPFF